MKVTSSPDNTSILILETEDHEVEFFLQDAIDRIRKNKPKEQVDYLINYVVNEILREQIKNFKAEGKWGDEKNEW